MNRRKFLNRLDLDYYLAVDDQVRSKTEVDDLAAIFHRNGLLLFNMKACLSKLLRKEKFINRLEQSRSQNAMNSDRLADDFLGDEIFFFPERSHYTISQGWRRR